MMRRKSRNRNFDQLVELLRANGFEVTPFAGVTGAVLTTKHGVGAALVPVQPAKGSSDPAAGFAVHPGIMVKGEVTRLLDRGYQKFIKSSQYELPATAHQLQAIHQFSEELK
ncbi:MAG: hypothetical protein WB567_04540, partial [Terracidiphilus sp.]